MDEGRRFYVTFSRGAVLRFLSQLDMMRLWERALRRAGLPLRYSQGYHPHPRLSLALPLVVGTTAAAEWLELELASAILPAEMCARLSPQLPKGIKLGWIGQACWEAPALASLLRGAEYEVELAQPLELDWLREKLQRFLEADSWMVEEWHKGKRRMRDVRQGVAELSLESWSDSSVRLRMVLHHRPEASGRPDRVLRALGLPESARVFRQQLLFQAPPPLQGQEVRCADE